MMQKIFARNITLFLLVAIVLLKTVDWQQCFIKRGRYLLGIAYNGHFLNSKDNTVYESYLKRHGSTNEIFQQSL